MEHPKPRTQLADPTCPGQSLTLDHNIVQTFSPRARTPILKILNTIQAANT